MAAYKATANFPRCEEFGLRSQIRRACVSVISNIAEGFKRTNIREQIQFYKIAEASLEEAKCQFFLARDLNYFDLNTYQKIDNMSLEAGRTLCGWIQSQKSKLPA